jgi:opacity protein-like surface antigen
MKNVVVGLLVVLLLSVAAVPAAAQGNTMILINGVAEVGSPRLVGLSTVKVESQGLGYYNLDLNTLKAKSRVLPGVEVRFNSEGHVSLGVEYERLDLLKVEHVSFPLGSWDETETAKGNAVLTTVYFNAGRRGQRVRPFVGIGGGGMLVKASQVVDNIHYTSHAPEIGWQPFWENPRRFSGSRWLPVVKGVVGVNFALTKHAILSLGGGYIGRPVVIFGLGLH